MAVGYYKDHVKRIVTRVNTFNGRAYRQDFYADRCLRDIIGPVSESQRMLPYGDIRQKACCARELVQQFAQNKVSCTRRR